MEHSEIMAWSLEGRIDPIQFRRIGSYWPAEVGQFCVRHQLLAKIETD